MGNTCSPLVAQNRLAVPARPRDLPGRAMRCACPGPGRASWALVALVPCGAPYGLVNEPGQGRAGGRWSRRASPWNKAAACGQARAGQGQAGREKSGADCLRNASDWPPEAASLPQRICGGFGLGLPLTARRVLFRSPARSGGQVAGCRGPREPARSAAAAARPWGCLVITRPRLGDHVHAVGVVGVGCGGAASAARHGRPAPGTRRGASGRGRPPPASPRPVRGLWRGG